MSAAPAVFMRKNSGHSVCGRFAAAVCGSDGEGGAGNFPL